MPNEYSFFNYRRNLVVILIFLQLLTVASIILLSRINTERVLIDNAYETMAKTITQSVDHTRSFLKPAYSTGDTMKLLANNGVINFNDIETVEKLFFTELTINKHFAGIYIANQYGDFIYMLRQDPNSFSGKTLKEVYQTKIIADNVEEREVTFHWRRKDFSQSRKQFVKEYSYNPLIRPWYGLASQSKKTVWTEPYTFFTSKKRGVTIATPFYNKDTNMSGVIGIDIELDQLSSFLDNLNNDGYVRITDTKNHFIAESNDEKVLDYEKIQQLLNIENDSPKELQGTFKEKENEYLFVQELLKSDPREPDWKIFTYAKTSPFLTDVRSNEKRNILIALMTLFISILISIIIARKTSKPVENWMNQASTDNLTQLHNRHFFFNMGNTRYNAYKKDQDHRLALMMLDIDKFKEVNDNFGHNVGDEVLKRIAKCLDSLIEDDDLLARFGGEEFILLTEVDTHKQALQLAQQIRQAIEKLDIRTTAGIINVTTSIGVCVTDKKLELSFNEFIDNADKALYYSKDNGRNRVTLTKNKEILNP